jgi:hypothetical protein
MATARTPSTARDPASRLAATVAREIELLTAQRERLRHRQDDLRDRLRDLDDELSALNKRQHDLDRLLGDHRVPAAASRARLLGGAALRRHAVAHLLATGQHHDIHYRTWYEQLAADGLLIRGANPAATFLTNITRSPLITRGERPGTYRLDPDAPQRINTLLVKARDRLHATAVARTDNAPQRPERLRALVNSSSASSTRSPNATKSPPRRPEKIRAAHAGPRRPEPHRAVSTGDARPPLARRPPEPRASTPTLPSVLVMAVTVGPGDGRNRLPISGSGMPTRFGRKDARKRHAGPSTSAYRSTTNVTRRQRPATPVASRAAAATSAGTPRRNLRVPGAWQAGRRFAGLRGRGGPGARARA